MTTALLIIDVQEALCSGPYGAFDAPGVLQRINHVSGLARAAGALVVLIQHDAPGGVLAHGSAGWQLASGLVVQPSDVRLGKQATDSFHHTGLHALLRAHGTTQLVVCGLQSEFCVDTTTRRAMALGYPVKLVADGHSTSNTAVLTAAQISAHHNTTLANITSFGPRTVAVPAAEVVF